MKLVAVGVHRRRHRVLRDGPDQVRGGPGPACRDRGENRAAGPDADGGPRRLVISSDFYAVYQAAGKKADGLVNLYCWAHVRRHFVRAGDASPEQLKHWTDGWLERIKNLYVAHDELMAAWQDTPRRTPRRTRAGRVGTRVAGQGGSRCPPERGLRRLGRGDDRDRPDPEQADGRPGPAGTGEEGARHPGPGMGRAGRAPELPDGVAWTTTPPSA